MEIWHFWVIAALLFFIVEIFTPGFAMACISIGAIGGAVASACGLEFGWQILIFAVATALSLAFIRPFIVKLFFKEKDKNTPTNADALIGRTAIVTESIDADRNQGRVKIDGDDWKAVSQDGRIFKAGTKVKVVGINSIVLTVKAEEQV